MFSGIVETTTRLLALERSGANITFRFRRPDGWELKLDQSIAHDGVCLTVDALPDVDSYTVTAMDETLRRTNLGRLRVGDSVNLERSMLSGARLDGHIVQGHVDRTARVTAVVPADGSTVLSFAYDSAPDDLRRGYAVVEKGSVAVDGVSLTAYAVGESSFSVSIIPYTAEHTDLGQLAVGDVVNLEFDIIGKYIARLFPGMQK